MITIIHGDDTAASRSYYSSLKEQTNATTSLSGNTLSLTHLAQILEGGGLFSDPKDIFIEDFLVQKKQGADFQAISDYLLIHAGEHNIYFWEGKEITKTILNHYKSAVIKTFKIPQTLFQFLDSLKPGSSKNALTLFQKVREQTEVELVFFMLIRHFRILLAIQSHAVIDETKRMADWQKAKYQKQAGLFPSSHLITLYRNLHEIDVQQKSGGLPYGLSTSIDFFLMDL